MISEKNLKRIHEIKNLIVNFYADEQENLTNCVIKIDQLYKNEKLNYASDIAQLKNLIEKQNKAMVKLLDLSKDLKKETLGLNEYKIQAYEQLKQIEALKEYADHKEECKILYLGGKDECTCGLDDIMKK